MNEDLKKHDIKLINRNYIEISGVSKIISFDSNIFVLDSCMGNININGSLLEVIKLDTQDGIVKIKGNIDSIVYVDKKQKKSESLWNSLFK